MRSRSFETWKILKLDNTLQTADDFRHAFSLVGCKIGKWGEELLYSAQFATSVKENRISTFELVLVSGLQLGFSEDTSRDKIYARACEEDLMMLPPVAGPHCRLQHLDQSRCENGDGILLGMSPIKDSSKSLGIFSLAHNHKDGLLLGASLGHPYHSWPTRFRWLFAKRV
jgi:hypothetical protein